VSQQHAEGHFAAARIGVGEEFWDGARDRSVEFDEAALVEEHGCGGGGYGLGQRSEIEQRGDINVKTPTSRKRREKWGTLGVFIYELSERFQGAEFASFRNRDRGGGKGSLGDSFAQDGEGGRKYIVLVFERCLQPRV
jgi:hypothetical protein